MLVEQLDHSVHAPERQEVALLALRKLLVIEHSQVGCCTLRMCERLPWAAVCPDCVVCAEMLTGGAGG